MSEEPTLETPLDPSDHVGPKKRSAAPPSGQVERTADEGKSWRTRWKTRVDRILPHRALEPEDRLTSPLPGIILFLSLLGVAALSIFLMRPPAPLPASASADQYSAARAFTHIQALAARPRPVGSQAHAEAQAYLVAQLKHLGLETQVQKAVAVGGQMVVNVENVLARLPGSKGGGKAVLLVAHYDSVPTGPGAKDDGSGVAALLETARALTAGNQPLANDVIFLFTDAEEAAGDMHGARAFVEKHPWAKDVGLVLSFDAGDSTGSTYTSESSSGNNWLISHYAQAVSYPLASSLSAEKNREEAADSDFNVFLEARYPGLGFGSIGQSAYYHTVLDNPADVDLGSLQHQGSYALSLVRHFGNLDLHGAHRGDAVYFDAFGAHLLVHYPRMWIAPLLIMAGLLWMGTLVFGLRKRDVSVRGVLLGALASFLVVAVLAVAGYLLWRLLVLVYPQYRPGLYAGVSTYNSMYYFVAFAAVGTGLAAVLHSALRTRTRTAELAMGALVLWLAVAVAVSLWLPGASYVATWPMVFGCCGLWGWLALSRSRRPGGWRIAWLALFSVLAVLLVAPFLYAGAFALSIHLIWVPMAVLGLLVGLLSLPLAIIARPYKWWLPALMGVIVAIFLVAGHLTSTYTPERPLQDAVLYGLNADQGKASWIGFGGPDVWTKQFFGGDGGGDVSDIWPDTQAVQKAPAPLAELTAPTVENLGATASGVFHLRVVPASGTWNVFLYALPSPTPVTYYVDERPIKSDYGWMGYMAPPAEGFDLTVKAPGLDSLRLRVATETLGLPTTPGFTYSARPAWIIPTADYYFSDSTWVAKTFSFGEE
jgi:hypothetical protein